MQRLFRPLLSAVFGAVLVAATVSQAAAFPTRPISLIVPWAAGGGTDAIARQIASQMERELGQAVTVVNRTGGSGVVGHSAIATAEPDGYTIGLITLEINMMHWVGLTEMTYADFTPLALMNEDPSAIHVNVDSPYETLGDLLDAIRQNPGGLAASGTGQGGSWHLALAGMLREQGIDPNAVQWVPSTGAATALTELAAGGVDFVSCSLPEARALIEAGRLRSLGIMSSERADILPDVPTIEEAVGSTWTGGVWRGMAGPEGMPADIAARYEEVLKTIYDSAEFQDFMEARGFDVLWGTADEFGAFMAENNEDIGAILKELGLAQAG